MSVKGKVIQIIDDDSDLRILVRRVLEAAGCTVVEAASVREGILMNEKVTPDLVILDMMMPEHDGRVFLRARKKSPILAAVPVLVLSASTDKTMILEAMGLGASHYLIKPFQAKILLQRLRQVFMKIEGQKVNFDPEKLPQVEIQVAGDLEAMNAQVAQIALPVSFKRDEVITISSEALENADLGPLVCTASNRVAEIRDGRYVQLFKLRALSAEKSEILFDWMKSWK